MKAPVHPVRWHAPQPLWGRLEAPGAGDAAAPADLRPALLRFASDDFMERMLATLARDPARLDALVARSETWRQPMAEPADLLPHAPVPAHTLAALRGTAARRPGPAPVPARQDGEEGADGAGALKLYQAVHQRHYLVAASLVCRLPGLPDRAVQPGGSEQLGFVVRRLLSPTGRAEAASTDEYAYVKDAGGARWLRVGAAAAAGRAVAGEEMLPLFPLAFHDDAGHARRLWAGLVPVGRREEYLGTAVACATAPDFAAGQLQSLAPLTPAPVATRRLARVAQFQMEVAEPWKALVRAAYRTSDSLTDALSLDDKTEPPEARLKRVQDFNLQQQQLSWLVLLDMADFLAAHLKPLWQVIDTDGQGADQLAPPLATLCEWLDGALPEALLSGLPPQALSLRPRTPTLRHALKAIRAREVRDALEAAQQHYDEGSLGGTAWPPFHGLLAGLSWPGCTPTGPYLTLPETGPAAAAADAAPAEERLPPDPSIERQAPDPARAHTDRIDALTALVGRALDEGSDADAPPLPYALKLSNELGKAVGSGRFVVRFVYLRPACGPLHPPRLSGATEAFELASFFDPDAPARQIRITLPLDTSPAGLRKFNRNTAFVISDLLCGQLQRARGMGLGDLVRAVLPWPLHKDLDGASGPCRRGDSNIGMICALSLPIITICALVLLTVIVGLLDLVFRWLPYFVICFPVGLKGKK